MATITGTRAAAGFPTFDMKGGGLLQIAHAEVSVTASAINDVIQFCKIPNGATVLAFGFKSADLDASTAGIAKYHIVGGGGGDLATSSNIQAAIAFNWVDIAPQTALTAEGVLSMTITTATTTHQDGDVSVIVLFTTGE